MRGDWDDIRARCSERYLAHAAESGRKLDKLRGSYEALFGDIGPGGLDYSAAHSGVPYADAIPDEVARMLDMRRRYDEEFEGYRREVDEAARIVRALDDAEQAEAVTLRHLIGGTWAEVSHALGCSRSTAMRRCEAGLVALYPAIPFQWQVPSHPAI